MRLFIGYTAMGKSFYNNLENDFFCAWYESEDVARGSYIRQAAEKHPGYNLLSHAVFDITEIAASKPA